MTLKYDQEKDELKGTIKCFDDSKACEVGGDGKTHHYPTPEKAMENIRALQVAVYVMCGGGMIGKFAAEQPADFYIDQRVGRLNYPTRKIYQAVTVLRACAVAAGLDPRRMPPMPDFHSCWVF